MTEDYIFHCCLIRRQINVSSNIAATGASADELLAAVPSVDVNSDGEISLRGNAEAYVDTRGTANVNFNINYNEGKFESFAGIGLKTQHVPGGSVSRRSYDDG